MFARYWEKFLKVAYTTTSCRMRSGVRELDLHICDSAATERSQGCLYYC